MKYSLFWILMVGSCPYLSDSKILNNFILKSPLKKNLISHPLKNKIPLAGQSSAPAAVGSNEIQKQPPLYTKFFPIYPQELPLFFGLSSMMFWAIFVFTLARDTKDALIVTSCGAESIAFLKVYGVIPAATLFMILYSKLSSLLSPQVSLLFSSLLSFMSPSPL
jgi:hypothetical protein